MRSSYSSLIQRDTFHYHILQPGVCGLVLWSGSDHDPEKQKKTEKRSAGNTFRSFNKRAVRYSPSQAVRGSGENGTEHGRRAGGTLKTPEPEHTAGICRQEIRETAGEPERIHGWSGGDGAHPAFRTAAGTKLRNKSADRRALCRGVRVSRQELSSGSERSAAYRQKMFSNNAGRQPGLQSDFLISAPL